MILIAHRGNINGPDPLNENKQETITNCINKGYSVEIDVRRVNNELYLGHDNPDYKVDLEFLLKYKDYLWIHCKNLEALTYLTPLGLTTFSHDKDDYVLTSKGFIWAYPGKEVNENCICVMPEWEGDIKTFNKECFGVCSDYVDSIKDLQSLFYSNH
jgi:hypothetical protein